MKSLCTLLLVFFIFLFTSCGNSGAPANTIVDTGFNRTHLVTDTKPSDSLHNMDTSILVVDSISHVVLNGVPVESGRKSVYNAVYASWLRAYQKTGHLPLSFKLVQQGTVTMGIRGNIGDAVLQVQNDMKNYIAKDKYKKQFDKLSANEKDSMQSLHPVLFTKPF